MLIIFMSPETDEGRVSDLAELGWAEARLNQGPRLKFLGLYATRPRLGLDYRAIWSSLDFLTTGMINRHCRQRLTDRSLGGRKKYSNMS